MFYFWATCPGPYHVYFNLKMITIDENSLHICNVFGVLNNFRYRSYFYHKNLRISGLDRQICSSVKEVNMYFYNNLQCLQHIPVSVRSTRRQGNWENRREVTAQGGGQPGNSWLGHAQRPPQLEQWDTQGWWLRTFTQMASNFLLCIQQGLSFFLLPPPSVHPSFSLYFPPSITLFLSDSWISGSI